MTALTKLVDSAAAAVADIPHGARLAVGGFGLAGIPWFLIEALLEPGASDLTIVSNNCGHLPGIFVQRVVALSPQQAKDIEKRTTRRRQETHR